MRSISQYIVFALLSTPFIAVAETSSRNSVIEEVVVTAQKREESIQDTPVSATAFTGETMRALGFDSSVQVASHTPGLQMAPSFGEGNIPIVNIRGVGLLDFSEHNESPSAVYVDEFYKANLSGLDFQLFDIERAEVLRGPQGTLFGRNATGGLVHYLTVKPSREHSGFVDLTLGERGKQKLEAAIGGGLGATTSARLSVLYHKHDGYYENLYPGGPTGNQLDQWAVRGQLLFEPSDQLSVLLSLQAGENDNSGGNPYNHRSVAPNATTGLSEDAPTDFFGYTSPSSDPLAINVNRPTSLNTESTLAIARVEYTGDAMSFVSITGFESVDKTLWQDPDSSPNDVFGTTFQPEGDQFSQEFRLQGDADTSRWIAGVYYMNYENKGGQVADIPVFGIVQDVVWDMDVSTWAAFGQYELDFNDRLTGTLGLRYSDESKDYSNRIDTIVPGVGVVDTVAFDASTVGPLSTLDSDNLSFRVGLDYAVSEDTLVYGAVSRAYKGGTFNMGFFPLADLNDVPVQEEELTSIEVGFKSTIMDGRARLNGAVFSYDYNDHQAFVFDATTLSNFLFNNDASILGAELELYANPVDSIDLVLGVGWLDAQLENVQDPVPGGAIYDRDMAYAPSFSANALLRYNFDVSWGGYVSLQGDTHYNSETAYDPFNSPALLESGRAVTNLRVTWTSASERWGVSAFVDNVTDEAYRSYAFDLGSSIGVVQDIHGKPRWWGVSLRYNTE